MGRQDARRQPEHAAAGPTAEGPVEERRSPGVFVREYRPIRRRGVQRLAGEVWGGGRSVWEAESEGRELVVEHLSVAEERGPEAIRRLLGLGEDELVCVRRRRYVLDGRPVLFAASHFDAALVAGSAITEPDPGPGGVYARLEELGRGPVRFREEVRSRMPAPEEAECLGLEAGTPVVLVCRTAYAEDGAVVEVNDMLLDSSAYILEYDFTP